MNTGHKHCTRWSFGDMLWHKVTGDKGMVLGIQLRPQCAPAYLMVFEDSKAEERCVEFELTEDQPTTVTSEK